MCGIAGLWRWAADWPEDRLRAQAGRMADAIRHRGPDGEGVWCDASQGIAMTHRRLAIVDLSPLGAQPMLSHDGRRVLVFNGEIYNFPELRAELARAGVQVRSSGDTEVMLESFALWGVDATCRRMVGMFAFALWDRQDRTLTLGRDRLGKKPLYLVQGAGRLAFGSELKALRTLPDLSSALDVSALGEYLQFGYVAERHSILRDVTKVQPGELLTVDAAGEHQRRRYWQLTDVALGPRPYTLRNLNEAKAALQPVLQEATRCRMLSDVPLGAFLSGGIDSGLVVALMQRAGLGTTRTFSIGFEEASHDEAPVARAVAAHLGTAHTELYVSRRDAVALVPRLADIFDEPFADASQIPTTLLARLARPHVTVALTGDGGDEAFGGYLRYRNEYGASGKLYRLPAGVRHGLSGLLAGVPASAWDLAAQAVPSRRRPRFLANKVNKLARALAVDGREARAREYLTLWSPGDILRSQAGAGWSSGATIEVPAELDSSEAMQFWETLHYLPGDLLAKMDRATMQASLEARSPLLDHRVVAMAWQMAPDLKAGPQALKHVLRELLFDFVPREIVDLPKQGFSVPIGAWLRTELRPFAQDMLSYARRELGEWLDMAAVDRSWQALCSGQSGQAERVWAVVMLAQWWQRWQQPGQGGHGAAAS